MLRRSLTVLLLLLGLLVLTTTPAQSQHVLTLDFDTGPAGVTCGQVWVENGLDLYIIDTTADDCDAGGNCSFGVEGTSVWLYPARLIIDFGAAAVITRVEIDLIDWCGIGCTQAFLYNGATQVGYTSNTSSNIASTMGLVPPGGGATATHLAISSCEGELLGNSIRIYSETVDVEEGTWGTIRTLYR